MSVEVRRSERNDAHAEEDLAFVRMLGRACVMSSVSTVRPTREADARSAFDRLCEVVEAQPHVTLIAQRGGDRLGFLLMLDDLPDEVTLLPQAFVAYMAVEPGARGEGVGAALLSAAENEARARRLPYMALMVTEENVAARRLYDRAGYLTERRLLCKPL
jgi:ribosomal protein S18 acetylase RimI-like enzyme